MMNLLILSLIFFCSSLNSQTPQLIFHSGFERNTITTNPSPEYVDITGIDTSFSPPNDWVIDLENHPSIGSFIIQYAGGADTSRLAEITSDPVNPANKVLRFWIKYPNVPPPSVKGRVQANISNNPTGYTNLFYSIKLFLPIDLDTLKYFTTSLSWFTLMEFWNNPNWPTNNPYPFRIKVDLQKLGSAPDSLRLGVTAQTYDYVLSKFTNVWSSVNTDFAVPIGKWLNMELNVIEGDTTSGRFYLAVTPEGGDKNVIYNINNFTRHPSDLNPDGFTFFNPFKLYTSAATVDTLRKWGKLTNVYWDNFELWKDYTVPTDISSHNNEIPIRFTLYQNYPNPFNPSTVISYELLVESYVTLKVYDILGREVSTLINNEFKTAGKHEVAFTTSSASTFRQAQGYAGSASTSSAFATTNIYFYRLTAGNFSATRKFILIK